VFLYPESEQEGRLSLSRQPKADPSRIAHIAQQDFEFVDSQSDADVVIKKSGRELTIERQDALIPRYASRTAHIALDEEFNLLPILNAIAHFNHHLGRHGCNNPLQNVVRDDHDTLKDVTMEFYRLTTDMVPDTTVGNLLVDNQVTLQADEDAEYGIAIFNNSKYDLFPYLFSFDPSEYRIESFYLPPAGNMDPPLPQPKDSNPVRLPVGYGAGGDPFRFPPDASVQSNTTFLKLFVSTNYSDMECIQQESLSTLSSTQFVPRKLGRKQSKPEDRTRVWGSCVAAITEVSASGSISVGL